RCDPFLEITHFSGERPLVTGRRRRAPKQWGQFGGGLREPENVVDEEQYVLVLLVAEVLGDGECGEGDTKTRAGRLVHLTVDQSDLGAFQQYGEAVRTDLRVTLLILLNLDDTGFDHFVIEVIALAGALAHACKHRNATMELRDVIDELHDDDRLADAGAAEGANLASL